MSIKQITFAALALLASAVPAMAQSAPANNIDERVRSQMRVLTDKDREEAMLTGDTDIVLTRRTRLFTLSGSLDFSGTTNAYLSPVSPVNDAFGQAQIGVSMGTRLGGKVDIFASVGAVGVRYLDQHALNYNAISGGVGARANFGRLAVIASYQPTIVLTGDFKSRQLTSHRFQLSAAMPFQYRAFTIEPAASAERVIAHPGDYSAWSSSAGVTVSAPLSKRAPVLGYISGQYQRRNFDSYFTSLVGVDRRDDNWSASVGVVWRPMRWGEIRASYSFQRNFSTSDVNGYTAHSGTLGLSAAMRF